MDEQVPLFRKAFTKWNLMYQQRVAFSEIKKRTNTKYGTSLKYRSFTALKQQNFIVKMEKQQIFQLQRNAFNALQQTLWGGEKQRNDCVIADSHFSKTQRVMVFWFIRACYLRRKRLQEAFDQLSEKYLQKQRAQVFTILTTHYQL